MVYCPQRTDDPPALLEEFLNAHEATACSLRGRLGVREDWTRRWATLSHGERKRAQIGVAVWRQPEVLAMDEPSNHIDAAARDLLVGELRRYGGIGLLVSHDRRMLDGLCGQCLFLEPGSAVLRPGGYSKGRAYAKAEEARARKLHGQAQSEFRRLREELTRRRQKAAAEHRVRSKRGLAIRDHDAREKIDRARVADGKAGAGYRQLQGRTDQAAERLAGIRVREESALGIWLPEAVSRRDWLLRVPAGRLALGPERMLEFPDLAMEPTDRVALVGPNGCGKSALVAHVAGHLDLPPQRVLYMPQEIPAVQSVRIIEEVRRLDHATLGRAMTVVSRLGSEPGQVLQTEQPSPGEIRKVLLALGVAKGAHLIIMDEPTNHLDLPSVECLERALDDCPGGLLLVSHDTQFLSRLTRTRWQIDADPDGARLRVLTGWT